jgi:hypothetical protein
LRLPKKESFSKASIELTLSGYSLLEKEIVLMVGDSDE